MSEFPDTSASLIQRIKDPSDRRAWEEFEHLYRPVIFRIARAKGLQYADAFDLVQQVLQSVAFAIGKYEKNERGAPFRNWLGRVTRNAILKALSRRPRDVALGGSKMLDVFSEIPHPDEMTAALIQLEYRRELFRLAAEKIRNEVQPATWLAFEMTTVNGQTIDKAARTLGLSMGSVYAARSRVMRRIKQIVLDLDSEYSSS